MFQKVSEARTLLLNLHQTASIYQSSPSQSQNINTDHENKPVVIKTPVKSSQESSPGASDQDIKKPFTKLTNNHPDGKKKNAGKF